MTVRRAWVVPLALVLVTLAPTAAHATCNTTAYGDWSANCLTDSTHNKNSRYTLAIQVVLQHYGYYSGALDGSYGQQTYTAVVNYQAAHGLSADGQVGSNTWASLRNRLAASSVVRYPGWTSYYFPDDGANAGMRRNNTDNHWQLLKYSQGCLAGDACYYTMSTALP